VFGDVTLAQTPFASLGGNTYPLSVSEQATGAEQTDTTTNRGGLVTEQAVSSESVFNSGNVFLATSSESATASETQFTVLSALATMLEQAYGTATPSARADVNAQINTTATATDTPQANSQVFASISELATALDLPNGVRVFYVSVSESATGSNDQSVQVQFVGTVAEVAQATSAFTALKTKNVPVTGVQLYVLIGNTLVWATIDDSQNPNWQLIDVTQIPGWTRVPS
jgi:hypothetical protein